MRNFLALMVFLPVIFTMHSCSKSNNNSGTADSAYMKATIAGSAFSTVSPGSTSATLSQSGGINYVYINGLDANNKAIQFTLINVTSGGTYAIGTGMITAYYYPSGGFLGPSTAALTGAVVISSISPDIKGTFNFTTTDNVAVANGSFSVKSPF